MKAFWTSQARSTTIHDVRQRYAGDRKFDRNMRFAAKRDARNVGVTSNFYMITYTPVAALHSYDLHAVRTAKEGGTVRTVNPVKAWKLMSSFLHQGQHVFPAVRINNRVYSTAPIPADRLALPRERFDIGWEACELRHAGEVRLEAVKQFELRTIVNRLLSWAIAYHTSVHGGFSVVRESDGKLVCTEEGISVSGLRIFQGSTAVAQFVTATNQLSGPDTATMPIPSSTSLKSLPVGSHDNPVSVCCTAFVREYDYNKNKVAVFIIADASGSVGVSLWGRDKTSMVVGRQYTLQRVRVKEVPQSGRGSLPIELSMTDGSITEVPSTSAPQEPQTASVDKDSMLAIKIDTRCTVATEKSLWEEVKQHYGVGPYDETTQRRVARALQGTPVIVSSSLRHSVVRIVRFNVKSIDDIPIESSLRRTLEGIELGQPFAVMHDYQVLPLQALHCCFDPRIRSWQDVTVASCSFLPRRRTSVLDQFRVALSSGLLQWGFRLAEKPQSTKLIAILPDPAKVRQPHGQKKAFLLAGVGELREKPVTQLFCALTNSRGTNTDQTNVVTTAQSIAKKSNSPHFKAAATEAEVLQFIDSTLRPDGALRCHNASICIVTPDRDTKALRWLYAHCLMKGVVPVFMPPGAGERKVKLLSGNYGLNIESKFNLDPLRGVDVAVEVAHLRPKRILFIGIDSCHNRDLTTCAAIGILRTPQRNALFPAFWRNDIRGREIEQLTEHYRNIIDRAGAATGGVDEVIVFQDGNVFCELESMRNCTPQGCGLTFMCLHKRTNVRFMTHAPDAVNCARGCVVQSLVPIPHSNTPAAPSFFQQNHDCNMSTARTVQYTVHCVSPTLPAADVQRLSYALSTIQAPQPTKLPMPTRCAHKLAAVTERLMDSAADFCATAIPDAVLHRLWFL